MGMGMDSGWVMGEELGACLMITFWGRGPRMHSQKMRTSTYYWVFYLFVHFFRCTIGFRLNSLPPLVHSNCKFSWLPGSLYLNPSTRHWPQELATKTERKRKEKKKNEKWRNEANQRRGVGRGSPDHWPFGVGQLMMRRTPASQSIDLRFWAI